MSLSRSHEAEKLYTYISANIQRWIERTIIREMKTLARAANLPKGFIDGIYVKPIPKGFRFGNSWGSDEKPLGEWFEFGTDRHWIQPKDPNGVLAWEAVGTRKEKNAQAIYYKSGTKKGKMLYSKGHYVSGLPRTDAMSRGYERGFPLFKKLMAERIVAFEKRRGVKVSQR